MKNWIFSSLIYKFFKKIPQFYHFSVCHKILSSSENFIIVILRGSFLEKITADDNKFIYIIGSSYIIRKINFLSKRYNAAFQTVFSQSLLARSTTPEENSSFNLFKIIGFSLLIVGIVNIALLSAEIGDLNLPLIFFNLAIIFSALLLINNRINWGQALSDSVFIKFIDNCCKI